MGRLGITYEQVEAVADEILNSGSSATIEKVRHALGGTGSNSTIARHLSEWKAKRLMQSISPFAKLNTGLPDTLQRSVTETWEKIRTESQVENEKIRKEAEEVVGRVQQEKASAEKVAQETQEALEKANLVINRLQTDLKLTQSALIEEQKQRAVFEGRATLAENNFQVLRDETKQYIATIERLHQEKIVELERQLKTLEQKDQLEIDKLKEHAENQRQKHMVEFDQLSVAKQKIEKNLIKVETELQQQLLHNKELEEAKRLLEVDFKINKQRLREHEQKLVTFEKQMLVLNAEATQKDQVISDLKQQISVLQEKLEKNLERVGQLKAENKRLKVLKRQEQKEDK